MRRLWRATALFRATPYISFTRSFSSDTKRGCELPKEFSFLPKWRILPETKLTFALKSISDLPSNPPPSFPLLHRLLSLVSKISIAKRVPPGIAFESASVLLQRTRDSYRAKRSDDSFITSEDR